MCAPESCTFYPDSPLTCEYQVGWVCLGVRTCGLADSYLALSTAQREGPLS
jgi:hypothetical protein